jgi:hypothetical protein
MDAWAWVQLELWVGARLELPVGPLFCVINGATRDGRGQARPRALTFVEPPRGLACGDASRLISCATPTPSKWPTKACR